MEIQDSQFSSISEALKYFVPYILRASGNLIADMILHRSVLWSHNPYYGAHSSIEEKIRLVLIKTRIPYSMAQFWAVKRIEGTGCLLTTTHQPFSIYRLEKGYCSYRKECMRRNINVGPEADEAQLGPPGRAFRTGLVESSPDITLYRNQEFPLRDYAILHGLKSVVALPVFELDSNNILGVLEFLNCQRCPWPMSRELAINLKELGLRFDYNGSSPAPEKAFSYVGEEMYKMFEEVAKTHPLAVGLALGPCSVGCGPNCSAVLWSHSTEKCLGVEERIKLLFERVPIGPTGAHLIQFWALIWMEGRYFLTVLDQPFALSRPIKKVTCLYRKECIRGKIYVDDEEQLGPVVRSFKNGVIESSPDVRLYTIQEFLLRDYAVLWGIRQAMFLPIFELDGKVSVGVLEILSSQGSEFDDYIDDLVRELKKMGLTISYDQHHQPASERDYCHNDSAQLCLVTSYSNPVCQRESEFKDFLLANRFHHLQNKYGVAGKALNSLRACFCMNICNLGIADYPLAHYAKRCGFTLAVAICVKNTQFADKLYVLEFFLLPGDYSTEYIGGLLDSLLINVKQHLPPKFKIVSEDVPGEPFFLQIGNILETGNKAMSSGVNVADGRETNVTQGEHISVMHVDGTEATPLVIRENLSAMHDVETEATPLVEGETISEATLLIPQGEIYIMPLILLKRQH